MKESKLQFNNRWLWTFSFVFVLSLYSFRADAQISTVDPEPSERDLIDKPPALKRLEFLALNDSAQMSFLSNPPFVIIDLVNASASDLINATPDQIFITDSRFYNQSETPISLERDMLLYPDVFKIYQP